MDKKLVLFKDACRAHRECCPYKGTALTKCTTKCGANEPITPDGKCVYENCQYMEKFKEKLRSLRDGDKDTRG